MNINPNPRFGIRLALLCILANQTGCINLSHIHNYSDNANLGIKKADEIDYDFSKYCQDRCQMSAIDSFRISRKLNCPCSEYKSADSVVKVLRRALENYFSSLSALAKNGKTSYVDPLRKALKEEDLKVLGLKKDAVDAYAQLSDVLLRAFTDSFRQKMIKEFVRDANPALQVLLSKLEMIESENLVGLLDFKRERLYEQYQGLLRSRGVNDYEKQRTATDYYFALTQIQTQQDLVTVYSRNLKTIGKGHQKISENVDKISSADLIRNLSTYSQQILELISDFNKIKH